MGGECWSASPRAPTRASAGGRAGTVAWPSEASFGRGGRRPPRPTGTLPIGASASPAARALLTKASPRWLKGAIARQYGHEKIDLLEALRLLARAELLRSGEFVACLVTATGCSERAGKDAIRILRRGGYVDPVALPEYERARAYRVSEQGRVLLAHPHGWIVLRFARKLFTSCPSRAGARFQRPNEKGDLEAELARVERLLLVPRAERWKQRACACGRLRARRQPPARGRADHARRRRRDAHRSRHAHASRFPHRHDPGGDVRAGRPPDRASQGLARARSLPAGGARARRGASWRAILTEAREASSPHPSRGEIARVASPPAPLPLEAWLAIAPFPASSPRPGNRPTGGEQGTLAPLLAEGLELLSATRTIVEPREALAAAAFLHELDAKRARPPCRAGTRARRAHSRGQEPRPAGAGAGALRGVRASPRRGALVRQRGRDRASAEGRPQPPRARRGRAP